MISYLDGQQFLLRAKPRAPAYKIYKSPPKILKFFINSINCNFAFASSDPMFQKSWKRKVVGIRNNNKTKAENLVLKPKIKDKAPKILIRAALTSKTRIKGSPLAAV